MSVRQDAAAYLDARATAHCARGKLASFITQITHTMQRISEPSMVCDFRDKPTQWA
jgi:hypothetical protein